MDNHWKSHSIPVAEKASMKHFLTPILVFLLVMGSSPVHAGELDGNTLHCISKWGYTGGSTELGYKYFYGLTFVRGKVEKFEIVGDEVKTVQTVSYRLEGPNQVEWFYDIPVSKLTSRSNTLNRTTLEVNSDQCSLSSRAKINELFRVVIEAAKKKRKL